MLVGIDFDNTIVCYDELFHRLALEKGLIPPNLPPIKNHVRNYLRGLGREDAWTELQGEVYGTRMEDAAAFPGVIEFFRHCENCGIEVCIISHRTLFPYIGAKVNLHQAGRNWLENRGFFGGDGIGVSPHNVYFESVREAKLNRIRNTGCDVFIDDLPEFLKHPDFPPDVVRILFDPNGLHHDISDILRADAWENILRLITTHERLNARQIAAPGR